jgi:hypothetical protein
MKQINLEPDIRLLQVQMAQMGELISQAEAARLLCCERQNVFNYIKRGALTRYHIAGRTVVAKAEVLRLLEWRRHKPDYQKAVAVFHAKEEERKYGKRSRMEGSHQRIPGDEEAKREVRKKRLKRALADFLKHEPPGSTNIDI